MFLYGLTDSRRDFAYFLSLDLQPYDWLGMSKAQAKKLKTGSCRTLSSFELPTVPPRFVTFTDSSLILTSNNPPPITPFLSLLSLFFHFGTNYASWPHVKYLLTARATPLPRVQVSQQLPVSFHLYCYVVQSKVSIDTFHPCIRASRWTLRNSRVWLPYLTTMQLITSFGQWTADASSQTYRGYAS